MSTPPRGVRRLATALFTALSLVAVGGIAGCADDADAQAGSSPLRIGYQRFGGLSLVKARNAAPDAQWSLFESGPALTEALKAGAIDIGQVGEAPPIFAAAAKIPFSVVGTSAPIPQGEVVRDRTDDVRAFLTTYRKVTDWGIANPAERATVLAPELKIPLDVTTRALARSARPLAPVTPAVGAELQAIADGFTTLDLVPGPVDISGRVDDRFSAVFQ